MEKISDNAFYGCVSLTDVDMGNGVKEIGAYAFYKCSALTLLKLGENVSRIGEYAFMNCSSLTGLDLPSNLKEIGKYAFVGLKNVKAVFLPSTIEKIDKYAFASMNETTFYTDGDVNKWGKTWNGSYRPVIGGCIVVNGVVEGFTKNKDNMSNIGKFGGIAPPEKAGYTFVGWSAVMESEEAEYTIDKIEDIPDGVTVYAVFTFNQI